MSTVITRAQKALPMNPLQQIIANRRGELRLSYADIAKSGGLPKSTVHKIATTETWATTPHPETLDRLALGLNLPPDVVRRAASEAIGLTKVHTDAEGDDGLRMLVGSIASLSEDQRKQVAALVNAMMSES